MDDEDHTIYERRAAAIAGGFQALIDLQSEGILEKDAQKLGASRRDLTRSITELLKIRNEMVEMVGLEVEERESKIEAINSWDDERSDADKEIAKVQNSSLMTELKDKQNEQLQLDVRHPETNSDFV